MRALFFLILLVVELLTCQDRVELAGCLALGMYIDSDFDELATNQPFMNAHQAIGSPGPEAENEAWNHVRPAVAKLKMFYKYSTSIGKATAESRTIDMVLAVYLSGH